MWNHFSTPVRHKLIKYDRGVFHISILAPSSFDLERGRRGAILTPMRALSSESFHSEHFEAERLYHAVFGKPIPEVLEERFREASRRVFDAFPEDQKRLYASALRSVSDLEALEVAGRLTGRFRLLTAKLTVMMFLAETLPDHQAYFVNQASSRVRGIAAVAKGSMKTAYKLIKGLYLARTLRS